jgi:hypothetical protein
MITHYGCPIIGGNDMQGEQCKGNNVSCLSFAYLPAGTPCYIPDCVPSP